MVHRHLRRLIGRLVDRITLLLRIPWLGVTWLGVTLLRVGALLLGVAVLRLLWCRVASLLRRHPALRGELPSAPISSGRDRANRRGERSRLLVLLLLGLRGTAVHIARLWLMWIGVLYHVKLL